MVLFISLVVITIPMGYVYNSITIIFFVLYSILAAKKQHFTFRLALLLPVLLFALMALSLIWSIDVKSSLKALSKESALLFLPIAFYLNRPLLKRSVNDILKNYSICMCLFGAYFLIRAAIRYSSTGNADVFFYHELATAKINAIYLSALFSLALFVFVEKKNKTFWGYGAMLFLFLLVFLLSSKNIIIIDVFLILCYYIFFSGLPKKAMFSTLAIVCLLAGGLGYYGKIHERFTHELDTPPATEAADGIHRVTIAEAWNKPTFDGNHYFNGTAFRTYQARVFKELFTQEPVLLTGYGLNASRPKVEQKGIEHNVFHENTEHVSYNKLNFHNQYIEVFADLGLFGFLLVAAMVLLNLKNGLSHKYFVHIAFAVLMISLFLTESFLWRQRGVVFFTVFYCLFNDLLYVNPKKTGLKKAVV